MKQLSKEKSEFYNSNGRKVEPESDEGEADESIWREWTVSREYFG